jgi:hypothetical protein
MGQRPDLPADESDFLPYRSRTRLPHKACRPLVQRRAQVLRLGGASSFCVAPAIKKRRDREMFRTLIGPWLLNALWCRKITLTSFLHTGIAVREGGKWLPWFSASLATGDSDHATAEVTPMGRTWE